jgi:alpha-L-fucosidase
MKGARIVGVILSVLVSVSRAAEQAVEHDGPFKPTVESLKQYKCPEWFRDAKFGIWAHWGPQAVPMQGDWYARHMYAQGSEMYNYHVATYGHPSVFGYKDIIPLWKAEKWDADKLMALYKKAGARYFVSQAVHCDNFDLWNSKYNTWNAVAMGPKRDVVKEWQKAAQKQGLRFGVSEHLGYSRAWFQTSHGADTSGPKAGVPYDGADPKWRSLYHPASTLNGCYYSNEADWHQEWFQRMQDLVDQVHPDFFYTDGGIPFGTFGFRLMAHLYNSDMAKNNGKLQAVYTSKNFNKPETHGVFVEGTCTEDLERGMQQAIAPEPWQTDTSNGDWYYRQNDKYKTTSEVLHQLVDIVSKNGNLLLNIVQYPDGSLPPESVRLLEGLTPWFAVNGEAIYGTRPWLVSGEGPTQVSSGQFNESYAFTARDIRFTRSKDGGTLYAFVLGWPEDGKVTVKSLAKTAGAVSCVTLLGHTGKLAWEQTEQGLVVTLPPQKPCEHVFALKIAGHGLTPAVFRGAVSHTPAQRWEDAFVTGNGRLGAMLFGDPQNDTLVANHCRLFLPFGNREIVPDLARYLPELRQTIREKGYGAAMGFLLGKAKEQGYPGIIPTDPYHPGLFINIKQPAVGAIKDYERIEDFQTGEVTVRWKDDRGAFKRRLFVSRTDNLVALSLTGPAPSELVFPAVGHPLIQPQQQTTPEWVTYHNVYAKGKGGFDAAVRVIRKDEGRDVLLLIRIAPWKTPLPKERSEAWAYMPENHDFRHPGDYEAVPELADSSVVAYGAVDAAKELMPRVQKSLASVRPDYSRLFAPHAKAHGELFNRVALDLGGGPDGGKATEALLDLAKKEDRLPPALMEKMYDAGRYMLICSAGELLPNLQGIWTGSWEPAWSGDYTLDTNVQAAMASACSANLPELMEGYFRLIESFYPEWQLNAKRIYGCRGFLSNARASNTCLMLHWGDWEGVFWTAGSGWLASFFSDYAATTADRRFLETRVVPLLKGTAEFYEDFLAGTEKDGRVTFIPSYNPETDCGLNATMDIAVAREVLSNLIAACRDLKIEQSNVPKWEALLAKLPAYPVNNGGELTEWPAGTLYAGHRHHSQLYPCFQSFDPLFETDAKLRKAAQATVRAKIAGSDGGGEQSSFGRMQCGVAAAYLGMPEEAYSRLKVMAVKRSMAPSLITTHEPDAQCFNTDGNGGIPQIVNTMLLQSRPDFIDLLPALPQAWPNGSIKGLLARGGFTVDIAWKKGKVTDYRIASRKPGDVKVRVNGEIKTVRSVKL